MGQEGIAQSLSCGRALHEARDVKHLQVGGHGALCVGWGGVRLCVSTYRARMLCECSQTQSSLNTQSFRCVGEWRGTGAGRAHRGWGPGLAGRGWWWRQGVHGARGGPSGGRQT